MTPDIDPEWDEFVAEVSKWCYKNRMKVRVKIYKHVDDANVFVDPKPRKDRPSSQELQRRGRAIRKLVWGKTDCT